MSQMGSNRVAHLQGEGTQMERTLITIQPPNSLAPNQRRIEYLDTSFLLVLNFAIFSIICILICACIPKSRKYSSSVNPCHPVPCRCCQYFSNNTHLQCAIHPLTAMTEKAIDCRDYCPHSCQSDLKTDP